MELTITVLPQRLGELLGFRPFELIQPEQLVLWSGWIEHTAGPPVYLRRALTAPDPATDQGSRLGGRGRRFVSEYNGGAYGGPFWVWTAGGTATLIAEETALRC